MFAAPGLFYVLLPDFTRTATFRWTLAVVSMFVVYILLMFWAIYWQTERYLISRSDAVITAQAENFVSASPERRLQAIESLLRRDPRGVQHAGLFTADGERLAGNLERLPPSLQINGPAQRSLVPVGPNGTEVQIIRAVARTLQNGSVVIVGRNVDEIKEITDIIGLSLTIGFLPALCLSIAAGALLSARAQRRVRDVNASVQHIVAGNLRQRLPTRGSGDSFDRLSGIVNGMLDEIETLIHEIAGVGDDIAHDLRTPLTRVRIGLERGRANAVTVDDARTVIERAIRGIDQTLSIVTALLRIAEIEHSQRLAGFSKVALADLLHEVCDLYEPIAETKHITLKVNIKDQPTVHGDRDLLLEAIANLVDNAVKFTPEDGEVELSLFNTNGESVVRISDTGPGITAEERDIVTRRFYRSDRSRQTQGVGLGLSLVAAILRLHDFRLTISAGPGFVVEIAGPRDLGARDTGA